MRTDNFCPTTEDPTTAMIMIPFNMGVLVPKSGVKVAG